MPRKKLSLEQGKKLLEDTKTRLRLEQEERTRVISNKGRIFMVN